MFVVCLTHPPTSIRAEGEQVIPPWIIFSGAGFVSQEEADFLDSLNIGWSFQSNAWADARYSRKWLRAFIATLEANGLGGGQRHLLLLDDLAAQKSASFNSIAMKGNVFPFPIPGGTYATTHHTQHPIIPQ